MWDEQRTIVVSFSGGRTSAFMLKMLLDTYPGARFVVIYCNTGRERWETLNFIEECSRRWNVRVHWLEAVIDNTGKGHGHGTTYRLTDYLGAWRPEYEASRLPQYVESEPHPFEAGIAKYGIPNRAFPWCSRELKMQPSIKFLKDLLPEGLDYDHAMGIRYDEYDRAGDNSKWYPLVGKGIVKAHINGYWANSPFDLQLQQFEGNCDLCWKKTVRKNLTVIEQRPERALWWWKMEDEHSENTAGGVRYGGTQYFHHLGKSTADLVDMVMRGRFHRWLDEEKVKGQNTLLDFGLPCDCGSLPGIKMFDGE
jgi:hypothetical protein